MLVFFTIKDMMNDASYRVEISCIALGILHTLSFFFYVSLV